jgi:hypothetical protein
VVLVNGRMTDTGMRPTRRRRILIAGETIFATSKLLTDAFSGYTTYLRGLDKDRQMSSRSGTGSRLSFEEVKLQ